MQYLSNENHIQRPSVNMNQADIDVHITTANPAKCFLNASQTDRFPLVFGHVFDNYFLFHSYLYR